MTKYYIITKYYDNVKVERYNEVKYYKINRDT